MNSKKKLHFRKKKCVLSSKLTLIWEKCNGKFPLVTSTFSCFLVIFNDISKVRSKRDFYHLFISNKIRRKEEKPPWSVNCISTCFSFIISFRCIKSLKFKNVGRIVNVKFMLWQIPSNWDTDKNSLSLICL